MSAVITVGGRIVGSGTSMASTPYFRVPNGPRDGLTANGGDQSYGQTGTVGFVSYTAAGPGTGAYTAMQSLGSYNLVVALGGSYEGWQASNRNKENLVTAIKGEGSYANLRNAFHPPYVFLYSVIESSANVASGASYQGYTDLVRSQNWWTYTTGGGSGTLLQSPNSGFYEINYTYAWAASAGSAGVDEPICGNVYGALWNGYGPAQAGAIYFCDSLLTLNPQYFTTQGNGAAPNADGVFLDNCFTFPNGGGNLPSGTASWDGIGTQTNSTLAAYPAGASSLLSRGQAHFFQTMQSYLFSRNPGSYYLNFGNFGDYFNVVGFGSPNSYTASAMAGVFHGGLVEDVFGTGGSSFQTYQSFAQVLQGYHDTMDFCLYPKIVGIGIHLPATDGSSTATWLVGGVSTTVSAGTTLEYQCMRAGLCFTLLDEGYAVFIVSGNQWNLTRYYDEQGDDSLSQVNVGKNYLGIRIGSRPTAAAFANGMWAAPFANALVLFNPWGNGSQTLSLAQIQAVYPGSWRCLSGSQQPGINTGMSYTSRTFGDPDGQILLRA